MTAAAESTPPSATESDSENPPDADNATTPPPASEQQSEAVAHADAGAETEGDAAVEDAPTAAGETRIG